MLPIKNSIISFDIILCVAKTYYSGNRISVKELYALMPYSYSSVRYYNFELINDEWLQHNVCNDDGRVKYVEPTLQLITKLNEFANHLNCLLLKKFKNV